MPRSAAGRTAPARGRGEDAWTGPTSSRPASADRRSSTTARRRRGPSMSAASAARSSSTSSPAPSATPASRRPSSTAIDDLDPMDAQALLTPDAVEREMGRPLAHVPDPAGDCHESYARHFAGIFIDTFRGLGHRPGPLLLDERHLPDRADGRLHPDRAGPRRDGPRHLPPGRERPAPRRVAARSRSSARTAAGSGRRSSTDWDGETVAIECRAEPRRPGPPAAAGRAG